MERTGRQRVASTQECPPLATALSYLSFRAKRGICGAPRSFPDSQGQTYRQFQPSLFSFSEHILFIRSEAEGSAVLRNFRANCWRKLRTPARRAPSEDTFRTRSSL